MLHVAICDDCISELIQMKNYMLDYETEKSIVFDIETFHHPDDLLKALDKVQFNVYILDIVMPMINGITLGYELRHMDDECQIIYTTFAKEYALQAYGVYPLSFLVKPVSKEHLYQILDYMLKKVKKQPETIYSIKTREGVVRMNMDNIGYVEHCDRRIVYHMLSGEKITSVMLRRPFALEIAPLLKRSEFVQVHTSYVCNIHQIQNVKAMMLCMKDGTMIPISKSFVQNRKKLLK